MSAAQERASLPGIVRDNGVTTEVFNCLKLPVAHERHLWQATFLWFTCPGDPAPPPHTFIQGPYIGLCDRCDGGKGDQFIHIQEVTPVTRPRKPWRVVLGGPNGDTQEEFTSERKAYDHVIAERAKLTAGQTETLRIRVYEWSSPGRWKLFDDGLELF